MLANRAVPAIGAAHIQVFPFRHILFTKVQKITRPSTLSLPPMLTKWRTTDDYRYLGVISASLGIGALAGLLCFLPWCVAYWRRRGTVASLV
jgi:hypothetical protein